MPWYANSPILSKKIQQGEFELLKSLKEVQSSIMVPRRMSKDSTSVQNKGYQ